MKKKVLLAKAVTAFAVIAALTQTASASIVNARCTDANDNLDAAQAAGRAKWARKCYPSLRPLLRGAEAIDMKHTDGSIVPGYPIFGVANEAGDVVTFWKAPTDPNVGCEAATQYTMVGICRAGCYTPDQQVLFADGYLAIGSDTAKAQKEIVTLSADSTFGNLSFEARPLEQIVRDLTPHEQDILKIRTQSKGELKVTLEHPLVDSEGRMRDAKSLKVGESLVRADGSTDVITEISKGKYFGRVYNVMVNGLDPLQQVVVAQGYLNGSIHYQNEGVKDLNRELLRKGNLLDLIVK